MKSLSLFLLIGVGVCAYAQPSNPSPGRSGSAAREGSGISSDQADAILSELKQIRILLERQNPPPPPEPTALRGSVKVAPNDRFLGNANAPITMVEFTDYQCPFCKDFHKNTFPGLKRDFIDTGKLRFVSRDMPLDFHQNAQYAAEAARCAADQGKFWQMRDKLFENSPRFTAEDLLRYATEIGVNNATYKNCVSNHKFEVDVRLNLAQAGSLKINGTPAFVIGPTTPEGVDGEIVEGAMPFNVFSTVLHGLLAKLAQ
jgi:protein-disulfide isomerase